MKAKVLGLIIVLIVLGFLGLASYLILSYAQTNNVSPNLTASSTHSL